MLAGRIVDKVNVVKFNIIFLLLTALGGLLLIKINTQNIRILLFIDLNICRMGRRSLRTLRSLLRPAAAQTDAAISKKLHM